MLSGPQETRYQSYPYRTSRRSLLFRQNLSAFLESVNTLILNYLICPLADKRCKVTTFFANDNDFQQKTFDTTPKSAEKATHQSSEQTPPIHATDCRFLAPNAAFASLFCAFSLFSLVDLNRIITFADIRPRRSTCHTLPSRLISQGCDCSL